jgi:hypothetical protein
MSRQKQMDIFNSGNECCMQYSKEEFWKTGSFYSHHQCNNGVRLAQQAHICHVEIRLVFIETMVQLAKAKDWVHAS